MRTAVVVLMLVLLPWRLWAADAMQVGMAQGVAAGASAEALADMPADCPMLAAAAGDAPDGSAVHCPACHLCAATACAAAVAGLPHASPAAPPPALAPRWASAALAPDLRPPIS